MSATPDATQPLTDSDLESVQRLKEGYEVIRNEIGKMIVCSCSNLS